ncbi:hypothetical protein ACFVY1_14200 [Streptomyces sp. NPDC058293]|uniref:hypothetical protein n=1 Tax=unclassified Streptomyces TaxID=2593676 RepID=UPI0033AD2724
MPHLIILARRRSRLTPVHSRLTVVTAAVALTVGLTGTVATTASASATTPARQTASSGRSAPSAPTGLMVEYDRNTLTATITWDPNSERDLAGYRVYRRVAESTSWNLVSGSAPLTATSTTDVPPATGDTYAYEVHAVDRAGNESAAIGEWNIVSRDTTPPSVPTGLTGQGTTAGNTVRWQASSDHVDHYEVWAALEGQQDQDGPDIVSGTAFTDAQAAQGVAVTYTVDAVDAEGQHSLVSQPATAIRPAPGTAPKPVGLTAQYRGDAVRISWDTASGGMGEMYRIYSRYPDPAAWSQVSTAAPYSGYTDVPLIGSYFYVVSVDDQGRESAPAFTSVS